MGSAPPGSTLRGLGDACLHPTMVVEVFTPQLVQGHGSDLLGQVLCRGHSGW